MRAASSPSRSSLALVSFRELHCPPWAVYMPARQPGRQPGQAGEKVSVSHLLSHMLLTLFSVVSNSLSFSVLPFSCSLSKLSYLEIDVFFFFFFLSGELFVLQGHVKNFIREQTAQRRWYRSICYKTFRCVCGGGGGGG